MEKCLNSQMVETENVTDFKLILQKRKAEEIKKNASQKTKIVIKVK